VRVPDAGHINVESGHGEWPLGVALLQSLVGEGGLTPVASAAVDTAPRPEAIASLHAA